MFKRERDSLLAAIKIYQVGRNNQDLMMQTAVAEMLKLGGLYVKFAQLLLLNQNLAQAITPELHREVFDRVRVAQNSTIANFIDIPDFAYLEKSMMYINHKPSFAGSFAVVFEATLNDGAEVIIKVLRPNIRKTLRRDLRLVSMVAKPLGLFSEEIRVALAGTLKLFRQTTMQETNYLQEIKYAADLEHTFENDEKIHIPHTYAELSNEKYIVQEKISGIWLSEIMEQNLKSNEAVEYVKNRTGSDLRQQLYTLGSVMLHRTLSDSPVHGDPHPGNIVLMPDNKVGMIDFGMIAYPLVNRLALLEYIKEQIKGMDGDIDLARLMLSIVRFHANYLYRAVLSLSEVYKRPLFDEMYAFLKKEISAQGWNINDTLVAEGEYSDMLSGNINQNNRFALIPKMDRPLTQKAMLSLWRTNDELGFRNITLQVFKDTVQKVETENTTVDWTEPKMAAHDAFAVVVKWLSLISEKDPKLFKQLKVLFLPTQTRAKKRELRVS